MGQTLHRVLLHIVFSTKLRADLIDSTIESDLFAYMGGICRNHRSPLLAINGTTNHVHLLVALATTVSVADLLMDVKKDSFKSKGAPGFGWQDGYGAFSIGESAREDVLGYIRRQKEHHRTRSSSSYCGGTTWSMTRVTSGSDATSVRCDPFGVVVDAGHSPGAALVAPRRRSAPGCLLAALRAARQFAAWQRRPAVFRLSVFHPLVTPSPGSSITETYSTRNLNRFDSCRYRPMVERPHPPSHAEEFTHGTS